jgi:hypothetical protein
LNLQPTQKTAAVAGAWTVLGFVPFEMWMERHGPASTIASNILWLAAFAIFLFLPVYFLVFGKHKPFQRDWFINKEERARYGVIVKRMFIWFVSAGAFGAAWSGLLNYFLA